MYIKNSLSLVIIAASMILSAGVANAQEIEVQAGDMQVSVDNGRVSIDSNDSDRSFSLLERISSWHIFGSPKPKPEPVVTGKTLDCDGATYGDRSTHINRSGTGVIQTSSSSTTMTCH